MNLSTERLLDKICTTDDCSVRLTKSNCKDALKLEARGFVELIPISTGGSWVAATNEGVLEYHKRNPT